MRSPFRALSRAVALLLTTTAAVSCGDRLGDRGRAAVPDTAAWSLATPARWRIGEAAGPQPYVLDRVFSGLLASDGTALVGNSGTQQIRIFDRAGRYVAATGRQGGGPGEFRGINWMSRFRGDSILVFDLRSQRFSVLTERGTFVRSFQNPAAGGPAFPLGVFPDGSVMVGLEKSYDPRVQTGRVRGAMTLHRIAADGAQAVAIRRVPGAEWLLYGDGTRYRSTRLPFDRAGLVVVAGDRIIYGSSDSTRLHVMDSSGRDVATVELPLRTRHLGNNEVAAGIEEAVDDRREREMVRRELSSFGRIEAPTITALRVDSEGNLWIRGYPPAGSASTKWLVLTPAGKLVGSLMMPVAWVPLDIRNRLLLVRERDVEGVERVSLREVAE